jgi:hypothetical protein
MIIMTMMMIIMNKRTERYQGQVSNLPLPSCASLGRLTIFCFRLELRNLEKVWRLSAAASVSSLIKCG